MRYLCTLLIFVAATIGAHENEHKHRQYLKPGADLRLSHNATSNTRVGEFQSIDLQFTRPSDETPEAIVITLNPGSELTLAQPHHVELSTHNNIARLPIRVAANTAGKHYLGIHAEVSYANGQTLFRVFELAISTNKQAAPANKVRQNQAHYTSTGRKISILASHESLSRSDP